MKTDQWLPGARGEEKVYKRIGQGSFRGDETVLCPYCGSGYTNLYIYQSSYRAVHQRKINVIV